MTKRLDRRAFFASIAAVAAAPFVPKPIPAVMRDDRSGMALRILKQWKPLDPLVFHKHAFALTWPAAGEVVNVRLPERFRKDI